MPSHMKSPMSCVGPSCEGCSAANCYAEGGKVGKVHGTPSNSQAIRGGRDADVKGVHRSFMPRDPGTSSAGGHISGHGYGSNSETAKRIHREKLEEQRSMPKPHGNYAAGGEVEDHKVRDKKMVALADEIAKKHDLKKKYDHHVPRGTMGNITTMSIGKPFAEGGEVEEKMHHSPAGGSKHRRAGSNRVRREDAQEGVHKSRSIYTPGESNMGYSVRSGDMEGAKRVAHDKIKEQRPLGHRARLSEFAEGGEVHDSFEGPNEDHSMENELKEAMGTELLDALERKDRKGILSSIEAIVLSMKHGE